MKKGYLIIGIVLFVAFLTVSVIAQSKGSECGRRYRPMGAGRMHRGSPDGGAGPSVNIILKLKEELGLSDEQVEKLEVIKNDVQGQFKATAEAVKDKRDALQKAVESRAVEGEIRKAASELGNAIGDQAVLRVSIKAKVDGILTDAQKAKLQELRERRRERRGKSERVTGERRKGRKGSGRRAGRAAAFERIDSDGDGTISLEEFEAHMEQMRERPSGERPRGQRRPRY